MKPYLLMLMLLAVSPLAAQSVTYDLADYGAVADDSVDNCKAVTEFVADVSTYSGNGVVEAKCSMPKAGKAYKTSCGFVFTKPVNFHGGCTIDYSGTGDVVTLGPSTSPSNSIGRFAWTVNGINFRGGATMAAGIHIRPWIIVARIHDNTFYNFGNASAYSIDAPNGPINEIHVYNNMAWNEDGIAGRNFSRFNDDKTGTAQAGNNSVWFINNLVAGGPNDTTGQTGPCSGIGLYLGTSHSKIGYNSFFGYNANILVANAGNVWGTSIADNAMDTANCSLNGVNTNIHLGSPSTSGTIDSVKINGNDFCRGTLFDKSGNTGTVAFINSSITDNHIPSVCAGPLTNFTGTTTGTYHFGNTGFTSYPSWNNTPQGFPSGGTAVPAGSSRDMPTALLALVTFINLFLLLVVYRRRRPA